MNWILWSMVYFREIFFWFDGWMTFIRMIFLYFFKSYGIFLTIKWHFYIDTTFFERIERYFEPSEISVVLRMGDMAWKTGESLLGLIYIHQNQSLLVLCIWVQLSAPDAEITWKIEWKLIGSSTLVRKRKKNCWK